MIRKEEILEVIEEQPFISFKGLSIHFGVNRRKIQYFMEKYDIKRDRKLLQKINNGSRSKTIKLSKECLEFINGSLLGDAWISKYQLSEKSTANNSNFNIKHSIKQLEYAYYKKQLLECYGYNVRITNRHEKSTIGNRIIISDSITISTNNNSLLNSIRDLWYPDNKKVVPKNLILTPLTLAIWFMDDGSKHTSSYYLHTQGFSLDDIKLLQKYLYRDFQIETSIHKSRNLFNLYIKTKSCENFKTLIFPYITDSMLYKIHGSH